MIAELLAGVSQFGLAGAALRRTARRVAAGLAASLLVLGVLLLAIAFAATGAFLSSAEVVVPAVAALLVAGGLAMLAGLLVVATYVCLRKGGRRLAQPAAAQVGASPLQQALMAIVAGMVAGNRCFAGDRRKARYPVAGAARDPWVGDWLVRGELKPMLTLPAQAAGDARKDVPCCLATPSGTFARPHGSCAAPIFGTTPRWTS